MQNVVAPQPIVRMAGISKSFTGTDAVRNVDLEILPGEVHGLVGENGAGKSTLMRVLAGIYPDYSGEIFFGGRPARIHTPRIARELGIALVHQELSLIPELSVAENMFLGREAPSSIPGLISRRRIEKKPARFWPKLRLTYPLPRESTNCLSPNSSWLKSPREFQCIRRFSSWTSRPLR